MILNISGRCDIVAFHTEWLMNRYKEGFVDVRNPFYHEHVSRIYFDDVDAIVFCTKNPCPILPYLHEFTQPILFHITLTPYKKEIEPNVINKTKIIDAIKQLSKILPKKNIYVRYDPIFISDTYTLDYHIRAFKRMCELLDGSIEHVIISFLDEYKNVEKNKSILNYKKITDDECRFLASHFSRIGNEHGIKIQTCAENIDLSQQGVFKEDCLSKQLAFELTNKKFKRWNARGKLCDCVEMADIGHYNTCHHLCKYCYANYDEKQIKNNLRLHDPHSTMLVDQIKEDDIIKIRR